MVLAVSTAARASLSIKRKRQSFCNRVRAMNRSEAMAYVEMAVRKGIAISSVSPVGREPRFSLAYSDVYGPSVWLRLPRWMARLLCRGWMRQKRTAEPQGESRDDG